MFCTNLGKNTEMTETLKQSVRRIAKFLDKNIPHKHWKTSFEKNCLSPVG